MKLTDEQVWALERTAELKKHRGEAVEDAEKAVARLRAAVARTVELAERWGSSR
jgi:hypothetical protein